MAVPINIVALKKSVRAPRAEDWQPIFNMIASDKSLKDICEELGLHKPTVMTRMHGDEELERQYLLARAFRADALAEKAIAIAEGVMDGSVEAKNARVAAPIYQWAAAQLNPRAWGQSLHRTEITGKDGAELQPGQNVVIFQLPDNGR